MRTTINHALDLLESSEHDLAGDNLTELVRVLRRVQRDYLEIIENALSLLLQSERDECVDYLRQERQKLDISRERISSMIRDEDRWQHELQRLTIEYLFTRARLVDELRMFPEFAVEFLEKQSREKSVDETIIYLEKAMTGKQDLFNTLLGAVPSA